MKLETRNAFNTKLDKVNKRTRIFIFSTEKTVFLIDTHKTSNKKCLKKKINNNFRQTKTKTKLKSNWS